MLYSGENGGYTYSRAVRELGGDHRKIITVDIKNGGKWDMVNGPLYAELMEMVISGRVDTIIASPNCRVPSSNTLRYQE